MMPGPRPPMRGGMPPHPFMNPMQGRPPMGPNMRGAPGMRRGGGGLLSKLLGKGNAQPQGEMGAARAAGGSRAGGGILQAISNPSSINGFLNNTQKVLNTAQQIGPMVQQYGPLVRNLPAMWKLYRGLKDVPEEQASQEKDKTNTEVKAPAKQAPLQRKKAETDNKPEPSVSRNSRSRESKPKLYI
ncbi:hypothetical protein J7I93_02775 [Bacillus sp. ISL-47]|uniref:VrrA/YqfQ family protein n=1 Tax=Bacillus sp. ISL-47 TaxID=2819130 RepID=UPI001BEBA712|nr:VrrA/YqfQ family protein [Bacillus sp. ISL-47]MBT2687102.1 hypothetical protein [Bacillus sp. ISL-47]MBT2706755.1 hypothetical protein [Pseudomonas sp. ISL-84]